MDKQHAKRTGTRLYNIWNGMIGRCTRESYPSYKNYGGKGIRVCEEWINSFDAFREWALSHGYADNLTIDRIDSKADYSPDNCKWSSMKEQQNNKMNNHLVTFEGVTKTVAQWAEVLGIKQHTLYTRLKRNWSAEKALTTPARGRKQ